MNRVTRSKKSITMGIAILSLISFVISATAQTTRKQDRSYRSLTTTINNFLTVWLVNKDNERAMNFFSRRAFLNKGILSESCSGYIGDEEYASPNQIKNGVRRFLGDFSVATRHEALSDLLTKERLGNIDHNVSKGAEIHLSKTSKYRLFETSGFLKSGTLDAKGFSYRKNHFLVSGTKFLVVGLNAYDEGGTKQEAYLYFLWLGEHGKWKVVDAGMFCQ